LRSTRRAISSRSSSRRFKPGSRKIRNRRATCGNGLVGRRLRHKNTPPLATGPDLCLLVVRERQVSRP
jgi:hypothetical protein